MSEALEIKEPKAVKSRTYIRYWQAEGESIKTSKRIKDAHGQAVEHRKSTAACGKAGSKATPRVGIRLTDIERSVKVL